MVTGQAGGVIFRDRHKDGHAVWMASSGRVYRAADGSLRVVSIVRDVSDLEQARAALRESEERFQVMAERAFDLISEIDGDGTVLFLGANCRKLFGIEPEEMVGRRLGSTPLARRFDPEDRARFLEAFRVANMTSLLASSLFIVVAVVPISLVISTMAGFGIGLLRIPGARWLLLLFIFGLTLPFEGIITPLYFLARQMGILNTRLAIVLPLIGCSCRSPCSGCGPTS